MKTRVSVIMPLSRAGATARRAIDALVAQSWPEMEVIVVGSEAPPVDDPCIRFLPEADSNPALRRNRAAGIATGDILAFIDDDAFAEPEWVANAVAIFRSGGRVVAVGGPDSGPDDAPLGERISEMLLSTPHIGSGIACHEAPAVQFDVVRPFDVALVNLFVATDAFRRIGGFDETIGYIGEDTDLVSRLLPEGRVVYSPHVAVRHRRRPFPFAYLAQRWRYRLKTGERMLRPGGKSYRSSARVRLFLFGGAGFLLLAVGLPVIAAALAIVYAAATLLLGARRARFSRWLYPAIPLFFAAHHAVYFFAIVSGLVRSPFRRRGRMREDAGMLGRGER